MYLSPSYVEVSIKYYLGMGIKYGAGPLVQTGSLGEFVAGHRCSDFELRAVHVSGGRPKASKDTFDKYLAYGKFVVLLFTGSEYTVPTIVEGITEVWHIADGSHGKMVDELPARHCLGKSSFVHETGVVVVRPDLFVGWAGRAEGVSEYFEKLAGMYLS